jgi:phosphoribosyl 1,2-cyclic phosphate phosphodiesterase
MEQTTKLTFLGTAAANFLPELKTIYKDCFDKTARRASCMLIGENYLIDCGMYVMESIRIAGVDMSKITDIFVTHLHADHFVAEHAQQIAAGKEKPLRLWVRRDAELPPMENVEVVYLPRHTEVEVAEGVSVVSMDANHDPKSFPQHFIFTINGKKLMYALDGGWFLTETYNFMRKLRVDMAVLDATCGEKIGEWRIGEHNSLPMIRVMVPSLKTWGVFDEETRIYLSHIAPKLHAPHEEVVENVAKDGLLVAYDGLTVLL